ncbi:MAG: LPS assembly lipoprotein LptE, partial [Rhodospirillales bacterium]|nr:LPS assembly lipoprotein LptE [Rhodospirillales bacterium]
MKRIRSSRVFGRAALAACIFTAAALTGCGYSHEELFPEQYRTVAAPIFENRTFYKGAEFDLAEAVTKELERRTPYKVTSPASADTILEGVITRIEQDQIARRRPGGVPQEIEVTVTVNFQWKDLRSGDVIRQRTGFEAVGRHVPTAPLGEPFEVGRHVAV